MLRDIPTFKKASKLARYIESEFQNFRNRPAVAAYQKKYGETYLSVNSIEVETVRKIAQFYADTIKKGPRPVAIASPTVADYNSAASVVGIMLQFNKQNNCWEFTNYGTHELAYQHRPRKNNESKSHCGIEYVRIFTDQMDFRFATRMANAATYRNV